MRFLFGVHLHQPVGNFDHVFQDHVDLVYRPFLDFLERRDLFPVSVHISGPLIEWLERNTPGYLDRIGQLASDGRIELLAAGWTEPILAALLRSDRIAQVEQMREELHRRFGVTPTGLWLTERVWTPELAADLTDAGIAYALVDDRHLLATGRRREELHQPVETEAEHRRLALFAIDERLRYLVPFRPPEEFGAYLRTLHSRRAPLAILADDGEKFGGWPGTHDWVYTRGWLDQFADEIERLRGDGILELGTFAQALADTRSAGLSYLGVGSYREMETWALPAEAQLRIEALEARLGVAHMEGEDGIFVRGAHWRNFLARYPESNRMHKKAQWLSRLCRERGEPASARAALGRAQCNDAYWHGVFGGLYLPHLRAAIWAELADAEGELRRGEPITADEVDFDFDGLTEIWVHSAEASAVISPHRGGAIEELTRFSTQRNVTDVLTRRWEAYHETALQAHAEAALAQPGGMPSIHDLEHSLRLEHRPSVDLDDRTLWRERIVSADVTYDAYVAARYSPLISWTQVHMAHAIEIAPESVIVRFSTPPDVPSLQKTLTLSDRGGVRVEYQWSGTDHGAWFTSELTVNGEVSLSHDAAEEWRYPVETVSKSERGLDRTVQGTGILLRWPAEAGTGRAELG